MPSPLRFAKLAALGASKYAGISRAIRNSHWRQSRLLILCYHGLSFRDEHEWNPALYMKPETVRARFEALHRGGYQILPLDEGVKRLNEGTLPPRSVALTFDDGFYDFQDIAWPLLKEFGFPATLYVATEQCEWNEPVVHLVCSYMFWMHRGKTIDASASGHGTLDLRTVETRAETLKRLLADCGPPGSAERSSLAKSLADLLAIDHSDLARRRVLTIMSPEDVGRIARDGADIQLHTHSHIAPLEKEPFDEEIRKNRERLYEMTGKAADHFCYPSGRYDACHVPWLAGAGVLSATTCEAGLSTVNDHRLLLPRVLDQEGLNQLDFEGWLSGSTEILTRTSVPARKASVTHTDA